MQVQIRNVLFTNIVEFADKLEKVMTGGKVRFHLVELITILVPLTRNGMLLQFMVSTKTWINLLANVLLTFLVI